MAFLSTIAGKATVTLLLIAAIGFFVWRTVKILNPPEPIERNFGPYAVVSVDSGASITYEVRRRKQEHGLLPGISAPAVDQVGFDESRQSLTAMTGNSITICESKSKRLDRFEPGDVLGETGQCLQIEQLKAGWAWVTSDAPKAYQAAQTAARKAEHGIWAMKEYTGMPDGGVE
jgi:endonuclease YncB( thermonuclease family)